MKPTLADLIEHERDDVPLDDYDRFYEGAMTATMIVAGAALTVCGGILACALWVLA